MESKGKTVTFSNITSTIAVSNDGRLLHHKHRDCSTFRGERDLNTRLITESEIAQRQLEVRQGAYRARHAFTIAGIRQLFGSTFIALGMRLQGECENRRIATTQPAVVPQHGV